MKEQFNWPPCECCGEKLAFVWSDTHGIGVCVTCGLPYEIYHYDKNNKPVDGPPAVAIKPEWIEVAKRYWQETKGRVFPGVYDMGFLGGRNHTYSGATEEDIDRWVAWLKLHESELPK